MKPIVVLYHAQCWDGFGAAWAAWRKLKNKADYIAVEHQTPPPKGLKNKIVYMVDFCYPEEVIKTIIKNNKKVIVIDHHAIRQKSICMAKEYVFDNNHSGSVLSWMYFFPKKKIPNLLKYVEDIDLWKFKLNHSKEIMLAVDLMPYEFKVWNKIAKDLERKKNAKKYLVKGSAIAKYVKNMTEEIANLADEVIFEGYRVLAVNGPRFLRSDLGHKLVEMGYPFGIVWYLKGNEIHVSLRSRKDVDVSKIAQKYGGGGHKNASGFTFIIKPDNSFPWKIIKNKK